MQTGILFLQNDLPNGCAVLLLVFLIRIGNAVDKQGGIGLLGQDSRDIYRGGHQ